jgi:hypothetical protein
MGLQPMCPALLTGLVAACAAFVVALAPGVASANCPAGAVTGLFQGSTAGKGADEMSVTLNLTCARDRYVAQFFTSQGDFSTDKIRLADGRLDLDFVSSSAIGQASLVVSGDTLSGSFNTAGDVTTLSVKRVGSTLAINAWDPTLSLTPAQWRADIAAFATELPKLHANAFFSLSRAEFDSEVASLEQRVGHMNGDEAYVGLARIANSLGDGHTGVRMPPDRRDLPIQIARYGDDFRIVAVGHGLDRALGARILRIGNVEVGEAWRRALTITPRGELDQLREGRALSYLSSGMLLHGLDITPERSRATYELADDRGKGFRLTIAGLRAGEPAPALHGPVTAVAPLSKSEPGKDFWCRDLPDQKAVYCAFRGYIGLDAEAVQMLHLIDTSHPKKLIVDMRDNGGGDYTVGLRYLIFPIANRRDINVKGRLFVLVGPLTFSAAMANAAQFQDQTKAILVGQTIGEKPNSYQEPRQFRLPNSHLIVRASTIYYAFRNGGENVVRPDREIVPTWDDAKSGRDPVLDWVLAQQPA